MENKQFKKQDVSQDEQYEILPTDTPVPHPPARPISSPDNRTMPSNPASLPGNTFTSRRQFSLPGILPAEPIPSSPDNTFTPPPRQQFSLPGILPAGPHSSPGHPSIPTNPASLPGNTFMPAGPHSSPGN